MITDTLITIAQDTTQTGDGKSVIYSFCQQTRRHLSFNTSLVDAFDIKHFTVIYNDKVKYVNRGTDFETLQTSMAITKELQFMLNRT